MKTRFLGVMVYAALAAVGYADVISLKPGGTSASATIRATVAPGDKASIGFNLGNGASTVSFARTFHGQNFCSTNATLDLSANNAMHISGDCKLFDQVAGSIISGRCVLDLSPPAGDKPGATSMYVKDTTGKQVLVFSFPATAETGSVWITRK